MLQTKQMSLPKRTVINLLITANNASDKVNELLKPFDISSEQFNVLRILRGQRGVAANMCTIQERMIAKMSNTTRLVEKLLKKGLVNRNICPQNRRKVEITITPKGLDLLKEIDPLILSFEEDFVSGLGKDELETLNQYLEKLQRN
ncbi:MAG: MarR family transcriptional regulator [Bacteroidetes bacterium]|nr:MarR family transcriptional regulator [Bacteroidota bacterium]